jgi:hypothetical protein
MDKISMALDGEHHGVLCFSAAANVQQRKPETEVAIRKIDVLKS